LAQICIFAAVITCTECMAPLSLHVITQTVAAAVAMRPCIHCVAVAARS